MFDIIIVGAGPAGLTAAIYARRNDKKVLVFEKSSPGGQIINSPKIENYPGFKNISGAEFATKLYNQAQDLGAKFIFDEIIKIENFNKKKVLYTKSGKYEAKKVIIATGCMPKKLELQNEEKLIGKGVSYCATCDGAFYKDKTVAVYGGGNTACLDAIFLSNYVKNVFIICRSTIKAEQNLQNQIKEKNNIRIITNTIVTKLIGDEELKQIEIKTNDNTKLIDVDGLFVAIGQKPYANNFTNVLDIDKYGYALSNENCETKIKGIYVAGDVREKKVRQLTTAVADGTISSVNASI